MKNSRENMLFQKMFI